MTASEVVGLVVCCLCVLLVFIWWIYIVFGTYEVKPLGDGYVLSNGFKHYSIVNHCTGMVAIKTKKKVAYINSARVSNFWVLDLIASCQDKSY